MILSAKRRPGELVLPLLLIVAVIYLVAKASGSVFPFILSIALAYLLNPVISYFETRGYKRVMVVSILYCLVGAVTIYGIYYLSVLATKEASLLSEQWPQYFEKLKSLYFGLESKLLAKAPAMKPMYDKLALSLGEKIGSILGALPNKILSFLPELGELVLVPFITFFFLVEGRQMINAFLDLIPSRFVEMAQHIICEADEALGRYLRGISLEAFAMFLLALAGLSFMQLNYAFAIAVAMGASSLIPYVGPVVGGIAGGIAAFVQFGTLSSVVKVLLFFVALRFVDDWVLQPVILNRAVKVHPTVIVFSLLVGAELFGIWGVIFAMPATCIVKVFLEIAVELHRTEFDWKPRPEPTRISIPYT